MSHLAARSDLVARVRRIAGQVAAVEKALVADAPCATVLHRVAAVRGAMNGLLAEVIAEHLKDHVALPGLNDDARAKGAEDLLAVIRSYAK